MLLKWLILGMAWPANPIMTDRIPNWKDPSFRECDLMSLDRLQKVILWCWYDYHYVTWQISTGTDEDGPIGSTCWTKPFCFLGISYYRITNCITFLWNTRSLLSQTCIWFSDALCWLWWENGSSMEGLLRPVPYQYEINDTKANLFFG